MKILAMYLPQYHRVKENDEWWGMGYTDWVSTRNAKPIYEGHYQPHVPQNQNYYDLLDKKALEWQARIMKDYGIDGQCIYHYWFKDGRQILEKPAENLLKWTDIDMPFCFSWANQSWANSWSAVKNANIWCDDRETAKRGEGNGLLLEQQYGGEKDWIVHFNYLLPFFKDRRYIKYEGKPIFVVYQAVFMDVLEDMKTCWNELAQKEGFPGIYFIAASNKDESLVDEVLYPAPQIAMSNMLATAKTCNNLRQLDCTEVWECIIDNALIQKQGTTGGFIGYDDSPRRGVRGCEIINNSPEIFRKYMTKLLAINNYHNHPFTFINAWNEWGEGMHLEPDEKYGYAYLEGVLYAKKHYQDVEIGIKISANSKCNVPAGEPESKSESSMLKLFQEKEQRYASYWRTLDKWLYLIEHEKNISDILLSYGYNKIAIYGLGMLGKHLVYELKNSSVEIVCGIDRKGDDNSYDFPVYSLLDSAISVDVVIVTVCYDFNNIKHTLLSKGYNNILSLDTLLDNEKCSG